jgi:hypothetical protein
MDKKIKTYIIFTNIFNEKEYFFELRQFNYSPSISYNVHTLKRETNLFELMSKRLIDEQKIIDLFCGAEYRGTKWNSTIVKNWGISNQEYYFTNVYPREIISNMIKFTYDNSSNSEKDNTIKTGGKILLPYLRDLKINNILGEKI